MQDVNRHVQGLHVQIGTHRDAFTLPPMYSFLVAKVELLE